MERSLCSRWFSPQTLQGRKLHKVPRDAVSCVPCRGKGRKPWSHAVEQAVPELWLEAAGHWELWFSQTPEPRPAREPECSRGKLLVSSHHTGQAELGTAGKSWAGAELTDPGHQPHPVPVALAPAQGLLQKLPPPHGTQRG